MRCAQTVYVNDLKKISSGFCARRHAMWLFFSSKAGEGVILGLLHWAVVWHCHLNYLAFPSDTTLCNHGLPLFGITFLQTHHYTHFCISLSLHLTTTISMFSLYFPSIVFLESYMQYSSICMLSLFLIQCNLSPSQGIDFHFLK